MRRSKNNQTGRLFVIGVACLAVANDARAQVFLDETPPLAAGAASGDDAGFSVALDADTMVVGCVQHGTMGPGLARVFVRTGPGAPWMFQADLTASDGVALDEFGRSVAVWGSVAVVGAQSKGVGGQPYAGAAYVFERTGTSWNEVRRLVPQTPVGDAYFGASVAIRGNTILVGAPRAGNVGAVYVFEKTTTWNEVTKLGASSPLADARFGGSLSFEGDHLVTGAIFDTGVVAKSGAAHVFRRAIPGVNTSWTHEAKLVAPAGAALDEFGIGVAIDEDRIAVGAHQSDALGFDAGEAHVFERSGTNWFHGATLHPCVPQVDAHFGVEVVVKGDLVAVAAHVEDTLAPGGADSGTVSIFQPAAGGGWTASARITAADAGPDDRFGSSLAMDPETLLVGAPRHDGAADSSPERGAVYSYALREPTFVPYGAACPCNGGFVPSLSMKADPLCQGGAKVTLQVKNADGPTTGLVFLGPPASLPTGNGCTLLVSPIAVSFSIPIPGFGPGTGQVAIGAPISAATGPLVVGVQVFIVAPGVPGGYCATNGVLFSID